MKTTHEELLHLCNAVDKARKNAEVIKVSRTALSNLLLDHEELFNVLVDKSTVQRGKA